MKNDLIFEAEVFYQKSADISKEINHLLSNLEAEKINEELLKKIPDKRSKPGTVHGAEAQG